MTDGCDEQHWCLRGLVVIGWMKGGGMREWQRQTISAQECPSFVLPIIPCATHRRDQRPTILSSAPRVFEKKWRKPPSAGVRLEADSVHVTRGLRRCHVCMFSSSFLNSGYSSGLLWLGRDVLVCACSVSIPPGRYWCPELCVVVAQHRTDMSVFTPSAWVRYTCQLSSACPNFALAWPWGGNAIFRPMPLFWL